MATDAFELAETRCAAAAFNGFSLDPTAGVMDKQGMLRIWLSKPIYETLPFFYLVAGIGLLVASLYLDYWYWPELCLLGGAACLILGLLILLKRRDFRSEKRPGD